MAQVTHTIGSTNAPEGDLAWSIYPGSEIPPGALIVAFFATLTGGADGGEGYGAVDLSGWTVAASDSVTVQSDGEGPGVFTGYVLTRKHAPGAVYSVGTGAPYSLIQAWAVDGAGAVASPRVGGQSGSDLSWPGVAAGSGYVARLAWPPNGGFSVVNAFRAAHPPNVFPASDDVFTSGLIYVARAVWAIFDRSAGLGAVTLTGVNGAGGGGFAMQVVIVGGRPLPLRGIQRDDGLGRSAPRSKRGTSSRQMSVRGRGYL